MLFSGEHLLPCSNLVIEQAAKFVLG